MSEMDRDAVMKLRDEAMRMLRGHLADYERSRDPADLDLVQSWLNVVRAYGEILSRPC